MKTSVENKTDFTSEVCKALKDMGKAYLLILVIGTLALSLMFSSILAFIIGCCFIFYFLFMKPIDWLKKEYPHLDKKENTEDFWYCELIENSMNPENISSPWYRK